MTVQETNLANAFTSELTAQMGPTDVTADMDTTDGPEVPCFLTIDHNDPSKYEVILFDSSKTATAYTTSSSSNRYLAGSAAASGITHETGAKVRCAPLQQHFEDANDRIDFFSDHGNLTGRADDDHTQYVLRSILTTKGDLFARGVSAIERVGVGADGVPLVGKASVSQGVAFDVVKRAGIEADAIDHTKVADEAIRDEHFDDTDTPLARVFYVADITARDALANLRTGDQVLVTGLGDHGVEFFYNGSGWVPVRGQVIKRQVTGLVSSVDFDSIPDVFEDLELIVVGRSDVAANDATVSIVLNDVTTGYTRQQLDASDTSVTGARGTSQGSIGIGLVPGANSTADYPGMVEALIPAYKRTTFRWVAQGVSTSWTGSSGTRLTMRGGHRATTDVITKVTVAVTGNFVAGSVLTLIGK